MKQAFFTSKGKPNVDRITRHANGKCRRGGPRRAPAEILSSPTNAATIWNSAWDAAKVKCCAQRGLIITDADKHARLPASPQRG